MAGSFKMTDYLKNLEWPYEGHFIQLYITAMI